MAFMSIAYFCNVILRRPQACDSFENLIVFNVYATKNVKDDRSKINNKKGENVIVGTK